MTHCGGCLSRSDPVVIFQNQQKIWNTVRIDSSQYLMNKASLTAYEPSAPERVNWNQQSDRVHPHIQAVVVPSRGNSTKRSLTRDRPGACSPGGVGCDIKFNSYDRYLNRIKGRAPLRRESQPAPAGVMTGGKYYKTNIIPSCKCPLVGPDILRVPVRSATGIDLTPLGSIYKEGVILKWDGICFAEVISVLQDVLIVRYLNESGIPNDKIDVVYLKDLPRISIVDKSCFKTTPDYTGIHKYFDLLL
jgi:hypothetical protein